MAKPAAAPGGAPTPPNRLPTPPPRMVVVRTTPHAASSIGTAPWIRSWKYCSGCAMIARPAYRNLATSQALMTYPVRCNRLGSRETQMTPGLGDRSRSFVPGSIEVYPLRHQPARVALSGSSRARARKIQIPQSPSSGAACSSTSPHYAHEIAEYLFSTALPFLLESRQALRQPNVNVGIAELRGRCNGLGSGVGRLRTQTWRG